MGGRARERPKKSGCHLRQQLAVVQADNVRRGERRRGDYRGVAVHIPRNAPPMHFRQHTGVCVCVDGWAGGYT